jgi:hypothetical protein
MNYTHCRIGIHFIMYTQVIYKTLKKKGVFHSKQEEPAVIMFPNIF